MQYVKNEEECPKGHEAQYSKMLTAGSGSLSGAFGAPNLGDEPLRLGRDGGAPAQGVPGASGAEPGRARRAGGREGGAAPPSARPPSTLRRPLRGRQVPSEFGSAPSFLAA